MEQAVREEAEKEKLDREKKLIRAVRGPHGNLYILNTCENVCNNIFEMYSEYMTACISNVYIIYVKYIFLDRFCRFSYMCIYLKYILNICNIYVKCIANILEIHEKYILNIS